MLHLDGEFRSELDLEEVGTWTYCEHDSTEIILFAYSWTEEEEIHLWEPHKGPIPADLLNALLDPFVPLASWYSTIERLIIWFKLGIKTDISRWTDPMVICRSLSLPGSLEKVGQILNLGELKKRTEGKALIQMFCVPLKIGGDITLWGIEPTSYRDFDTHPTQWSRFCSYCEQDVRSEKFIYNMVKKFDLCDFDYQLFELDQKINDKGVQIDNVLLQGASIVVEKAKRDLVKKFKEISGIQNPNSPVQVLKFVREHGYSFPSINKTFVKRALAGESPLDDICREVLEIRQLLSKSSVSKLETCKRAVAKDGRLHHLFSFMGAARTHRWAGSLYQPQNLPKPSKDLEDHVDRCLELLKAADYETICKEFKSPLDVAVVALRPVLCASEGNHLVIADLSAIESRGSGYIAQCENLLDIFREGKDPYLAFAVQTEQRPYEDLEYEYKVLKQKKIRNNNKAPFLGCLGEHTKVLTEKGWKEITKVTLDDLLWDGVGWVQHQGLIYQGDKEVIDLFGVEITRDHRILTEEGWKEAWQIEEKTPLEKQAINLASGALEGLNITEIGFITSAIVGGVESKSHFTALAAKQEPTENAPLVQERSTETKVVSIPSSQNTPGKSLINSRIGTTVLFQDVVEGIQMPSPILKKEFLVNSSTSTSLSRIVSLCLILINRNIISIERITRETTKKVIYDLFLSKPTKEIKKILFGLSTTGRGYAHLNFGRSIALGTQIPVLSTENYKGDFLSKGSSKSKVKLGVPTYDILGVGSLNRFMILTKKGPLIVHNCSYGLSPGKITKDDEGNIVKSGLLKYAADMQIELTPEFSKLAVDVFRNTYPQIVDFWYELDRAWIGAVDRDNIVEAGAITFQMKGKVLAVTFPSGSSIHYIDPEVNWEERISKKGNKYQASILSYMGIDQETRQWTRVNTRGSKLFENIIQKFCRDLLGYGMLEVDKRGQDITIHVHDEVCTDTPESSNFGVDQLVECITTSPPWASDFLGGAEGFLSKHYVKA